jgi:Arc/MetJ-type ribon-helix-helix transcriptional regulator
MEKGLVNEIDNIVSRDASFQNRSEYIRTRLREDVQKDKRRLFDETALEIREMILKRGAKPGLITEKEKKEIADEFLRKKNFK